MLHRFPIKGLGRTVLAAAVLVAAGLAWAVTRTGEAGELSLAGEWTFRLDPGNAGMEGRWHEAQLPGKVRLPGSLFENGYGEEVSIDTKWTGDIVDRSWYTDPKYEPYRQPGNVKVPFWLQVVKYYVGPAWYQREVVIPEGWEGTRIVLSLERCHWETQVWVDSKYAGMRNSLCVPQEYDLTPLIAPGKHRLTIRVDNSLKINVGPNSHSVSDHTQTNWNGIVGRISLRASDPVWIDDLQVFPDIPQKTATVLVTLGNTTGRGAEGTLSLKARSFNSERVHEPSPKSLECIVPKAGGTVKVRYPLGEEALLWDEFTPNLYELAAHFRARDGRFTDSRKTAFGMRQVGVEGTQFTINGRKTFLRGTLECCIFPLTGYPPTDVASWLRIMRTLRAHGLNHVRFHSWCPPEAAFAAADQLGIMLQVEGPSWANQGATIGDGRPLDAFLKAEYDRIFKAYGNHPSFCFMAYGNEPAGRRQREFLGELVNDWKRKDRRRLYTSAAGWPLIPESDYHSTPDPRIQAWGAGLKSRVNANPPETLTDYRDFVSRHSVPVVSHEIGQWCVYPNFDEIEKYTGVLKPRNFEVFRDTLKGNHMLDQAKDFVIASGKLQALCYKEDIESLLRTPGMGGFQMLQLHDFPGQGTALVGVLDPFWDSKGYITAEEFHRFAGETVPLARVTKRTWKSDETFEADIEIAHFGPRPILNAKPTWTITDTTGKKVFSGNLPIRIVPIGNGIPLGRVSAPLSSVDTARQLRLTVTLEGTPFSNDWDFWVYPAWLDMTPGDIFVAVRLGEKTAEVLKAGGRVLLMPGIGQLKGDQYGKVPAGFSTIFWNTAWTGRQPPHTLGILCDPEHPALAEFPTEPHSNWQWWDLVSKSQCMILDSLPPRLRPIVQVIDDWVTNRRLGLIFEARVGGGKVLVCSMDLRSDLSGRPVASQMRHSLLEYMRSDAFAPQVELRAEEVRGLYTGPPVMTALGARIVKADSEAPGYEAHLAIDGDPATMWHTPWGGEAPGFPHEIVIGFEKVVTIRGFRYLPRQDMSNGRVATFELFLSTDGKWWGSPAATGRFENDTRERFVQFKTPQQCRFLRFVALSEVNGREFASMAELDVIVGK